MDFSIPDNLEMRVLSNMEKELRKENKELKRENEELKNDLGIYNSVKEKLKQEHIDLTRDIDILCNKLKEKCTKENASINGIDINLVELVEKEKERCKDELMKDIPKYLRRAINSLECELENEIIYNGGDVDEALRVLKNNVEILNNTWQDYKAYDWLLCKVEEEED